MVKWLAIYADLVCLLLGHDICNGSATRLNARMSCEIRTLSSNGRAQEQ